MALRYAGPAIDVAAIVSGLVMHLLFGRHAADAAFKALPDADFRPARALGLFAAMMAVLVLAKRAVGGGAADRPLWAAEAAVKCWPAGGLVALVAAMLVVGHGWRPGPLLAVAVVVPLLALLVADEPQVAFLAGLVLVAMGNGDDAQD